MDKKKGKFNKSFFIVNKLYLFVIFIGLTIQDITLGFYYFLMSAIIYIWKVLNSKVPIDINKEFDKITCTYKKANNRELKMDIWFPLEKHKKSHSLVYFCHGGGWISGFRNQPNNVSWCKYLAAKGFIVASIDYRYGYKNTMIDILSDYSDGLDFIKKKREEYNIDISNIILMGLSAGAHLSLLYSTYNTLMKNHQAMNGIRSVVAYYPPTNLKDIFISDNKSLFARFATIKTMKGNPQELDKVYEYYSPINYVSESMIPTLVVHGKNDNTVPFQSSVNFVKKLNEYKVKYEFLVHKKADHSFDTKLKDYATVNILDKTVRFMKKSVHRRDIHENNKH
ncbi:alpha/beta hydrolase [Tissierella sp.]|uniref:alpha/beta hydrolase family protein n=1 Tax=Tissierella sp. TaxID=41274 RepID=UPI0028567B75|nr:alpha/beta hydrolase [Tissierella sp.]MDR7857284.1 alpha/beta hydrolase [Tissierella sp.]